MRRKVAILLAGLLAIQFSVSAYSQMTIVELPEARQLLVASGFDGTTLVFDVKEDLLRTSNAELIDQRFIPASTFKVFSTLVALQTGIIESKDSIIAWNGIESSRPEINRDLDLKTAFQLSAVPHFQYLVRTIGAERMQQFLDLANYGNRNMAGGVDQFWLTGELRISPREQIEFLTRLYADALPFSLEVMEEVREIMRGETTDEYSIHAKTGWATLGESEHTGWWIGWVEKPDRPYFFATVLQTTTPGETFANARLELTRQMLVMLHIL